MSSDYFGIGAGIKGAIRVFMTCARGTGRSEALVSSLKKGDMVVCHNPQETKRLVNICRDRKIEGVKIITCTKDKLHYLHQHPRPEGRLIFDHSWIESFYINAIEGAERDLGYIAKQFGREEKEEQPIEFKRLEESKWRG